MTIDELVAKNKQYTQILGEFSHGKNSHAYLIKSADSLLATNMCYMLAANFAGCDVEKVQKGIHPDVQILGSDGKIDVAAVSGLIENLHVASYQADVKVYILLGAENMNETAQNKLLKSLEEPPSRVIFLLTAASTENILPTVLSRVNLVSLDPVATCDVIEYLRGFGATETAAEVAAANCGGNITLANKLTTPDFLKMHQIALDALQNLNSSGLCLHYSSLLEPKNIDKAELFDVFMLLARDVLMIVAGQPELVVNQFCLPQLQVAAAGLNMVAANKIIKVCLQCKQDLQYNANATAVLDKFLFSLAQEKNKCKKL